MARTLDNPLWRRADIVKISLSIDSIKDLTWDEHQLIRKKMDKDLEVR